MSDLTVTDNGDMDRLLQTLTGMAQLRKTMPEMKKAYQGAVDKLQAAYVRGAPRDFFAAQKTNWRNRSNHLPMHKSVRKSVKTPARPKKYAVLAKVGFNVGTRKGGSRKKDATRSHHAHLPVLGTVPRFHKNRRRIPGGFTTRQRIPGGSVSLGYNGARPTGQVARTVPRAKAQIDTQLASAIPQAWQVIESTIGTAIEKEFLS